MRNRRRILLILSPLALLVVAFVGAVVWAYFVNPPQPEPIIQGQPLSYWAMLLQNPSAGTAQASAAQTGAIPAAFPLQAGVQPTVSSATSIELQLRDLSKRRPTLAELTASSNWIARSTIEQPRIVQPVVAVPMPVAAAFAKTTIGPNDVAILLKAVEMQDDPLRRAYRNVFPKLPGWMQQRWPASMDPAPVRTNAALVLTLGNNTQFNIDLMKTHANPFVRKFAVLAIAFNANVRDASATEALAVALKDKDPVVRAKAAMGMGLYGRNKSAVIPRLKQSMGDRDAKVRFYAAAALAEIPESRAAALPEILRGLKNNDVYVRNAASSTLSLYYPEESEKLTAK